MRQIVTAAGVLLIAGYMAWCFYDPFDPKTDLRGKRVLVCGASTGIGEEVAYLYARGGAKLVLTARRKNVLEKVQAKCRDLGATQVEIFPGDLSLMNTSKAVVEYSNSIMGGIDHLILNHVIGQYQLWNSKQDLEHATNMVKVNLLSYVYLATHSLPHLEVSSGTIVVVSSVAGVVPSAMTNMLTGTKHALHGFFGSLRQDLMIQNSNISISIVPLGLFGTESAIESTKGKTPESILKAMTFRDPADAAFAIARAGTLRLRESFYPFFDTKLLQWLNFVFPEFMETILVGMFKDAYGSASKSS